MKRESKLETFPLQERLTSFPWANWQRSPYRQWPFSLKLRQISVLNLTLGPDSSSGSTSDLPLLITSGEDLNREHWVGEKERLDGVYIPGVTGGAVGQVDVDFTLWRPVLLLLPRALGRQSQKLGCQLVDIINLQVFRAVSFKLETRVLYVTQQWEWPGWHWPRGKILRWHHLVFSEKYIFSRIVSFSAWVRFCY